MKQPITVEPRMGGLTSFSASYNNGDDIMARATAFIYFNNNGKTIGTVNDFLTQAMNQNWCTDGDFNLYPTITEITGFIPGNDPEFYSGISIECYRVASSSDTLIAPPRSGDDRRDRLTLFNFLVESENAWRSCFLQFINKAMIYFGSRNAIVYINKSGGTEVIEITEA